MGSLLPDREIEEMQRILLQLQVKAAGMTERLQPEDDLTLADRIYHMRRMRAAAFGPAAAVLGEPSWDILLDLFIARRRGRTITTSSACIASHAPPTTALRHLDGLEAHGLIERGEIRDRRCRTITLSDKGDAVMARWLGQWRGITATSAGAATAASAAPQTCRLPGAAAGEG